MIVIIYSLKIIATRRMYYVSIFLDFIKKSIEKKYFTETVIVQFSKLLENNKYISNNLEIIKLKLYL